MDSNISTIMLEIQELAAAGCFVCNISTIMLEMDRMLRPSGRAYIRDSVTLMPEIQEVAAAMGWQTSLHDSSEGPHASWKFLACEKRLLRA
ncbi:hypothetical protein Syun_003376 [Stephania yunnanensis]|uniref:Methyltransferase n=1 Tax=Stephania yunnanensis TaxID=152371 RepID=A0AAP0Q1K2_9MAGN